MKYYKKIRPCLNKIWYNWDTGPVLIFLVGGGETNQLTEEGK